jgi:hypothetical protein
MNFADAGGGRSRAASMHLTLIAQLVYEFRKRCRRFFVWLMTNYGQELQHPVDSPSSNSRKL